MFRDLIPELSGQHRVIAPDLPGFGQSAQPARDAFQYTFENYAHVIYRFTETVGFRRFAIYVFDYGAPVGFRIAAAHPERITAIVTQNGNAYVEGLSEAFAPIQAYWRALGGAFSDAFLLHFFFLGAGMIDSGEAFIPAAAAVGPSFFFFGFFTSLFPRI